MPIKSTRLPKRTPLPKLKAAVTPRLTALPDVSKSYRATRAAATRKVR